MKNNQDELKYLQLDFNEMRATASSWKLILVWYGSHASREIHF